MSNKMDYLKISEQKASLDFVIDKFKKFFVVCYGCNHFVNNILYLSCIHE